jgi:uncharacterized protein YidB (DUF937 family)
MGLLDGMLGNVLGGLLHGSGAQGQGQGPNAIVQMALQLLQENGGVSGVVNKLRQAGYGAQADSWVGTGANQPIPADALQQALGSGQLGNLASKLGLSHGDAAGGLASMLPQIIDQMTPHGQIPENHGDMLAQALSMLQKSRSA